VLNQGQRDPAITMSRKRDRLMGHLKTVLVAPVLSWLDYGTPGLDF